ncbi:MFS transporter [Nocardia paucivorans]|uniref:MFS transporter n=1 Tax=Nocardia paucivorans TaxID=114259 RepID=UPI0003195972|nr:MFS transporter [Nocardia paucivorans]
MTETPAPAADISPAVSHRATWLPIAAALAAAGFCLRPAITAMGAALEFVPADIGPTVLGWVVTIPLWCYAIGGLAAPRPAARIGAERAVIGALAVMVAGQLLRVLGGAWALLTGTTITALATAVVSTLLPVLAARPGPGVARMTAVYAPAIGIGSAAGAFLTAPVSAVSSWRWGLGLWAPVTGLALVLWLYAFRRSGPADTERPPGAETTGPGPLDPVPWRTVLRSRLSWSLAVMFAAWAVTAFAVMSLLPSIYYDAGIDRARAGLLLGVAAAVGIPIAAVLPGLLRRTHRGPLRDGPLLLATAAPAAGLFGLLWSPADAAWLWAACVGAGLGTLSLLLALVPLKAPDRGTAIALSATAQGVGYALAGLGVATLSTLHVRTGDWQAVLWLLLAMFPVQVVAGMLAARSGVRAPRPATTP